MYCCCCKCIKHIYCKQYIIHSIISLIYKWPRRSILLCVCATNALMFIFLMNSLAKEYQPGTLYSSIYASIILRTHEAIQIYIYCVYVYILYMCVPRIDIL